MKRFAIRKVKCTAYSRQRWALKDCGFKFVVIDREWRKNKEAANDVWECHDEKYKNIDSFYSHAGAQLVADWFNENRANEWGHTFNVPSDVFMKAIELRDAA